MVEKIVYRNPPIDGTLLRDCPPVALDSLERNRDLVAAILAANARLEQCSADKAQLRDLLK